MTEYTDREKAVNAIAWLHNLERDDVRKRLLVAEEGNLNAISFFLRKMNMRPFNPDTDFQKIINEGMRISNKYSDEAAEREDAQKEFRAMIDSYMEPINIRLNKFLKWIKP